MRTLFIKLTLLAALLIGNPAYAGIVVVANKNSGIRSLTKIELVDLYMGRYTTLPNKQKAVLIDHNVDANIRTQFYDSLIGKSVAEVNAFWVRLLFIGRAKPPQVVEQTEAIIQRIAQDKNAIAYLYESEIDESLTVVYRFDGP